jgi:hypothetical protein
MVLCCSFFPEKPTENQGKKWLEGVEAVKVSLIFGDQRENFFVKCCFFPILNYCYRVIL